MAKVPLRAYLNDLQSLMNRESFQEVIGHCQHILKQYPKNLETYHILGRALIERHQMIDAADVFTRILSAVPDDFTAHLSLCGIYEETGDVGKAIYHLERAFEVQPDNPSLQEELRKLYEKRDGHAPERLQITQPALARLYFKGKLYNEAAAELQSALAAQPDRVDLLSLYAVTLWENDQAVEAGEVAARVLTRLPDGIEANRILANLWLAANRPSDAQPFAERVGALDPFLAWQILHPDGLPPPTDIFMVDRLRWDPRAAAMSMGDPDWVSSLGSDVFDAPDSVGLGGQPPTDALAAWMNEPAETLAPSGGAALPANWLDDDFGGDTSDAGAYGAPIPDWMSDFDDQPAAPAADAPDWFADVAPAAKPAAVVDDLPDWLGDTGNLSALPPAAGLPDWLDDAGGLSTAAQPTPAAEAPLDAMSWLMTGPLTPPEEKAAAPAPSTQGSGGDEFDFFFNEASAASTPPPTAAPPAPAPIAALDWLSETPAAPPASPSAPPASEIPSGLTAELDWRKAPPASPTSQTSPTSAGAAGAVDAFGDLFAGMDWQAPAEPPASAEPAAQDSLLGLDWLSTDSMSTPAAPPAESANTGGLDWLRPAQPPQADPAAQSDDLLTGLEWLTAGMTNTPAPQPDSGGLDWLTYGDAVPQRPAASGVPTAEERLSEDQLATLDDALAEMQFGQMGHPPAAETLTPVDDESLTADPVAWMQQFGLSPALPDESSPVEGLDKNDLAEFEALKTSTLGEAAPPPVKEVSSTDLLAFLGQSTIPAEGELPTEASPAYTPPVLDLSSFAAPPSPVPTPQADIQLEDEWLDAFDAPFATENPPVTAAPHPPPAPTPPAESFNVEALAWEPSEMPNFEEIQSETQLPAAAGVLDWLSNAPATPQGTEILSEPPAADMPDWMSAFGVAPTPPAPAPEPESVDALSWLGAADPVTVDPATADSAGIGGPAWLTETLAPPPTSATPAPIPDDFTFNIDELFGTASPETPNMQSGVAQQTDLVNTSQQAATPPPTDAGQTFTFKKPPAWKRRREEAPPPPAPSQAAGDLSDIDSWLTGLQSE